MADPTQTSSGVKELICRIRDEGVAAGREEAARIVAEAKDEAARILAEARATAERMRDQARARIEAERKAALEALQQAARDTTLTLRATVRTAFEARVKRLVSEATGHAEFIQSLVLVLAGRTADEYVKDKKAEVLIPEGVLGSGQLDPNDEQRLRQAVLAITGDALREGIELVTSEEVKGGARVRLVGEDLEIDLTDEAISELLLKMLRPRYRAIIADGD